MRERAGFFYFFLFFLLFLLCCLAVPQFSAVTFTALLHSPLSGVTRNEPYALATRKELKSRTRALWNFVVASATASASAAAAASAAARAMHTHTRTQTEPRCVTFCRLGRDRAACVYLPLYLPLSLLPLPLPLPVPLPHTLPFFLASDPSTCDRLGCIYLLLDNNSSFAGLRWLLSLPLMSGPMPLCVCVCIGVRVCVCAACVGLISA